MASTLHNASLVDTESLDKPGDGTWKQYGHASEVEEGRLSELSATSMNGMLAFTGLFAAVVAAFSIESYKSLSPDSSAQTNALLAQTNALLAQLVSAKTATNTTLIVEVEEPFRASATAIVVNALWFVGLIISLACALLVTMMQEWARGFKRAQLRSANANLEKHSLLLLFKHMGVQGYGLDRIASLTVALMHFAVAIFVVGLVINLFSANPITAALATAVSGVIALSYVIASVIPLLDATCPYSTPLTKVLTVIIIVLMSTISCLLAYTFLLCDTAYLRWIRRPSGPTRRFPSPRFMWHFLRDPFRTARIAARIMRVVARYIARPTFRRTGTLRNHIQVALTRKRGVAPGRPVLSKKALHFLWDRVGVTYILEHPRELHYLALRLLNAERSNFDSLVSGLRRDEELLAKVAVAIVSVDSVFAAKSAVRLLQALLLAENPNDEYSQVSLDEKWAFTQAGAIYDALPAFFDNVSRINRDALKKEDVSLLAAVSSLRWVLIRALHGMQGHPDPQSMARRSLRHLLGGFDGAESSLRLRSLSSDDGGEAKASLTADNDSCLELAYRNAFTLLAGASSCHWRGDWQSPDSPYLDPKSAPSMWCWPEVFNDAIQLRDKPSASQDFRDILTHNGLRAWTLPGSKFADPKDRTFDPVAVGALRALAKAVSFPELSPHTGGGSDVGDSATRVVYDGTATRGVKEGKADHARTTTGR